jgi:hypothetical protein
VFWFYYNRLFTQSQQDTYCKQANFLKKKDRHFERSCKVKSKFKSKIVLKSGGNLHTVLARTHGLSVIHIIHHPLKIEEAHDVPHQKEGNRN